MRSKLSLILLLFSTFTIFAVTFISLSQGPSIFRGSQNASSASQKKKSRSDSNEQEREFYNEGIQLNERNDEELEARSLQGASSTDNSSNSTANSTIPTNSTTNSSTNTSNPSPSTTPSQPTSYLFSVNPTQVYHSVLISGAVYHGINKIVDVGVRQKNIPPLTLDYNVTKFISTTYRKYSDHAVYMFKTKLANSNLKRINANFTVYYNYSSKAYALIWYSYHSFNYTKAELYPNGTASTNSTNSTDNSTQVASNTTSSGRIKITLEEINNDTQIYNGFAYGIKSIIKTAIIQKQIPYNCNNFSLSDLVKARYLPQGEGVRYWFYTNLQENDGDHLMEANFTVSYNNSTQKYRLAAYSYITRNNTNSTSPTDPNSPSNNTETGGNGGNSTNSTDPNNPTNPDNSTNTPDPNNGTDTNTTTPTNPNNGTDTPGDNNGGNSDNPDEEETSTETPDTEESDDPSDSSEPIKVDIKNVEGDGTGVKITADVSTKDTIEEYNVMVHIVIPKHRKN